MASSHRRRKKAKNSSERQKRKRAHMDVTSLRARTEQRRAGAAERRSPWVSWRCSRRRTRRIWSGSGSPRCARRCGAWTARSEVRSRRERVGDAAHSPEGASEPCTDDSRPNARGRGARDVLYSPRTRRDDRDSRPTDPDDGPSPDGPPPRPATRQTSSARRRVSRNPSRIALSATTCEACVFWRRRSSRLAGRSRACTKTRRR